MFLKQSVRRISGWLVGKIIEILMFFSGRVHVCLWSGVVGIKGLCVRILDINALLKDDYLDQVCADWLDTPNLSNSKNT